MRVLLLGWVCCFRTRISAVLVLFLPYWLHQCSFHTRAAVHTDLCLDSWHTAYWPLAALGHLCLPWPVIPDQYRTLGGGHNRLTTPLVADCSVASAFLIGLKAGTYHAIAYHQSLGV